MNLPDFPVRTTRTCSSLSFLMCPGLPLVSPPLSRLLNLFLEAGGMAASVECGLEVCFETCEFWLRALVQKSHSLRRERRLGSSVEGSFLSRQGLRRWSPIRSIVIDYGSKANAESLWSPLSSSCACFGDFLSLSYLSLQALVSLELKTSYPDEA